MTTRLADTVFRTDGDAWYKLTELTDQQALDKGCPGANCILQGAHGEIVGTIREVTGRNVQIPRARRRGYRAQFIAWGEPAGLRGYIGASYDIQHYDRQFAQPALGGQDR